MSLRPDVFRRNRWGAATDDLGAIDVVSDDDVLADDGDTHHDCLWRDRGSGRGLDAAGDDAVCSAAHDDSGTELVLWRVLFHALC